MARSSIHGHTGTVLSIDLDHFKMLNDTAGHEFVITFDVNKVLPGHSWRGGCW